MAFNLPSRRLPTQMARANAPGQRAMPGNTGVAAGVQAPGQVQAPARAGQAGISRSAPLLGKGIGGGRLGPIGGFAPPPNQLQPGPGGVPAAAAPAAPQSPLDMLLAENAKQAGSIQEMGQKNINALQRRNGANAAMTGMGMGSGYLSGQRSMLSQGLGAMSNAMAANSRDRSSILMDENRRQQDLADRDAGWKREDDIRLAGSKAEQDKTLRQGKADQLRSMFKEHWDPTRGEHSWFERELSNYQATGDDAKYQELLAYIQNNSAKPASGASAEPAGGEKLTHAQYTHERTNLDFQWKSGQLTQAEYKAKLDELESRRG